MDDVEDSEYANKSTSSLQETSLLSILHYCASEIVRDALTCTRIMNSCRQLDNIVVPKTGELELKLN